MVLTAATLGTLAAALGKGLTEVYSQSRQRQLNNQQDAIAKADYVDTDRILQSRLRTPYTSRTDFQDILSRQKALLDAQWKRVQGANAVAGSSGGLEAGAAQKQANAYSLADTMGNAAARASDYNDFTQNQIIANNANYAKNRVASLQRQASTVSGAAGQMQNTLTGVIGALNPTLDHDVLKMFALTKNNGQG